MTVEYRSGDGNIRGEPARIIDFGDWDANDWLGGLTNSPSPKR